MLSIGGLGVGSGDYFTFLAQQDYYLNGGEPPGRWWGQGANHLGLQEEVTQKQLHQLLQGFSPEGKPLVQNAGSDLRRAGFDLTFSAPKSVSALWASAPLELRAQIQAAHAAAVVAALEYIEQDAAICRQGKEGCIDVRAKLVAALFDHCTSRALEPQIHTHALVMNVGITEDGDTNALFHPLLFRHKMAAGAVYRAEFAAQLEQGPHLDVERVGFAFEVVGVPKELCHVWSTRRIQIEERLGPHGLDSAAAAAQACLDSRAAKTVVPPRTELFETWQQISINHGLTQELAKALAGKHPPMHQDIDLATRAENGVDLAINRLTQEFSHFTKRDLVQKAAEEAQALGVGAREVLHAVEKAMRNHDRLVVLGPDRLTTKEILKIERRMIETCVCLNLEDRHGVHDHILERAMRKLAPPANVLAQQAQAGGGGESAVKMELLRSRAEQLNAVRALTEKGDAVRVLEGVAGSGKTSTLGAARTVWNEGGYDVIGAAVSNRAARELQHRAGIPSTSVAKLLCQMDDSFAKTWTHHIHMIGRQALKKPTFKFEPLKLTDKTVLVVDEASMLDTRMLAKIVEHAAKHNAKVVLAGDRKQLQSIGPGGAFAHLADTIGKVELVTNVRQRTAEDRKMVRDVLDGNIAGALKNLAERDRLIVAPNSYKAMQRLVDDWHEKERGRFHEAQIFLVPTRSGVDALNAACQQKRIAEGSLDLSKAVSTSFVDPATKEERNVMLHPGDRVMLHKNNHMLNVDNGDTGTIVKITKTLRTHMVTVELDRDEKVIVPLNSYKHIAPGYATTVHKGQGSTVERAYIFASGGAQDHEMTYVQVTRAKEELRVYASEKEVGEDLRDLVSRMKRSGEKTMATEKPTREIPSQEIPNEDTSRKRGR